MQRFTQSLAATWVAQLHCLHISHDRHPKAAPSWRWIHDLCGIRQCVYLRDACEFPFSCTCFCGCCRCWRVGNVYLIFKHRQPLGVVPDNLGNRTSPVPTPDNANTLRHGCVFSNTRRPFPVPCASSRTRSRFNSVPQFTFPKNVCERRPAHDGSSEGAAARLGGGPDPGLRLHGAVNAYDPPCAKSLPHSLASAHSPRRCRSHK